MVEDFQQFIVDTTKTAVAHNYHVVTSAAILLEIRRDFIDGCKGIAGNRAFCQQAGEIDGGVFRLEPDHHVRCLAGQIELMLMDAHFHGVRARLDYCYEPSVGGF